MEEAAAARAVALVDAVVADLPVAEADLVAAGLLAGADLPVEVVDLPAAVVVLLLVVAKTKDSKA